MRQQKGVPEVVSWSCIPIQNFEDLSFFVYQSVWAVKVTFTAFLVSALVPKTDNTYQIDSASLHLPVIC